MFCAPAPGQTEQGVTNETIVLGQSCALSGPSEDLGKNMQAGLVAAFEQCNTQARCLDRKVVLLTKDDYYEPGQSIKNTRSLIEEDKVFLLIGSVGTPTSKAAAPIAQRAGVPFIAPYTGAGFLRKPVQKNIINIRAGYEEETRKLAEFLVKEKKMTRIACFYQNDSFGRAGLDGIASALKEHGIDLVAQDTYERNTVAVLGGVLRIQRAEPQAVLLVGSYQPCAEFIKLARVNEMGETLFCALSFTGSESLINPLRKKEENIIISQVIPSFNQSGLPIARDYLDAMKNFQPDFEPGYISFEGYIAGRFFLQVAGAVKGELNREKFIRRIKEQGQFNLGGIELTFGPDDHQGLDTIYLSRIVDSKIMEINPRR